MRVPKKVRMQNAKCKMQNAKLELRMQNAKLDSICLHFFGSPPQAANITKKRARFLSPYSHQPLR